jgi:hypothetical protein
VRILLGRPKVKFGTFAGPTTDRNKFYATLFTTVRKKWDKKKNKKDRVDDEEVPSVNSACSYPSPGSHENIRIRDSFQK